MVGPLNIAVDVHYPREGGAIAAGIAFADWASDRASRSEVVRISEVKPYRPGRFYERELPCLLAVLEKFEAPPATVVVDGFVTLGPEAKDGLGAHLYNLLGNLLGQRIPVIGVAKTPFAGTPADTEVYRGTSARPLHVTCRGIAHETAKQLILSMHGCHRLPTLLRAVDRACRGET